MGLEVWRLACSATDTDSRENTREERMLSTSEQLCVYGKKAFYLKDFWILYMIILVMKYTWNSHKVNPKLTLNFIGK